MYFVKDVKGRRRVPKIAIFVFLGAPSCQLFWSNFEEIHEFHMVRLISGRSVGDVVGRRFGCAYPSQIDDLARSREKKYKILLRVVYSR